MLPELQWQIALYLDVTNIDLYFPHLLANEIFLTDLLHRDYPGIKGDYKHLHQMKLFSKGIKETVQLEVLEHMRNIMPDYDSWVDFFDYMDINNFDYITEEYVLSVIKHSYNKLDLLKMYHNKSYIKSTIYFKNGVSYVYHIDFLLMALIIHNNYDFRFDIFVLIDRNNQVNGIYQNLIDQELYNLILDLPGKNELLKFTSDKEMTIRKPDFNDMIKDLRKFLSK